MRWLGIAVEPPEDDPLERLTWMVAGEEDDRPFERPIARPNSDDNTPAEDDDFERAD